MHKGVTFSKAAQSPSGAAAAAPAKQMTEKEAREARIAEIRAQYLAGSYQVDREKLARKLIDAHLTR
jgi:anti-sigma28 factor (negative regulator of flagellin synthesis)